MRSLNWIGNMSNTNEFLYTAQVVADQDAGRRQAARDVDAATGIGSIVTQLAAVYNNVLGTKFKVIYGYPSGPEMTLAMERGEVEGRSTSNPQVLAPTKAGGAGQVQFPHPGRHAEDSAVTRRCRCCASSPGTTTQRKIFDFISRAVVIARPIVTNRGRAAGARRGAAARLRRDARRSARSWRTPSGRISRSAPRAARSCSSSSPT